MALLTRLIVMLAAGGFTWLTKKVPWLSVFGAIGTVAGAVLTVIQIIKEVRSLV